MTMPVHMWLIGPKISSNLFDGKL
nr:unnamed protein product [Callosobruchus chinensis]CAH7750863.1 unnamed protein product [Callosobruchus chinensis]CAH7752721.1 unnamed protein product [Callosobruchus chinensis]CAH7753193.1 unnamed protein product [Callosobruchus chinensis]CAH7756953.1 unnamed protein product [Callosobruchus chinensis]